MLLVVSIGAVTMEDMSVEMSVKVDIMLKKHSSLDRNICV